MEGKFRQRTRTFGWGTRNKQTRRGKRKTHVQKTGVQRPLLPQVRPEPAPAL